MTGRRTGYAVALVVAILALVVSLAAAVTLTTSARGWHADDSARVSSPNGSGPGPAGAMMGQRRGDGGMMGDWNDRDAPSISTDQARAAAERWAAANQPGATVAAGIQMPMGYLFTLTRDGQNVGTIIVNDDTGQVAWWGAASPSPTGAPS